MFGFDRDFYDALKFRKDSGLRVALSKGNVFTVRMTQAFAKEHGFLDRNDAVKVAITEEPIMLSPELRVIELRPVAGGGIAGRDPWGTKENRAKTWAFNAMHWFPIMAHALPSFLMQDGAISIHKMKGDVTRIFINLDAVKASEDFPQFNWDDHWAQSEAEEAAFQAAKTPSEVGGDEERFRNFVNNLTGGEVLTMYNDPAENADVLEAADIVALKRIPEKYLLEELSARQNKRTEASAALREMAGLPPLQ